MTIQKRKVTKGLPVTMQWGTIPGVAGVVTTVGVKTVHVAPLHGGPPTLFWWTPFAARYESAAGAVLYARAA